MKVESSKTNQPDKKVSFQNKNANQASISPNKNEPLDFNPTPSKSFAQILAETRNPHDDDENFPLNRKPDRAKESSEADETGSEKETSRDVQTRDAVDEKEKNQSDEQEQSGDDSGGTNPGFGALVFPADNKIFNGNSTPAARSILHVADLERIVSAVRAQNLKNAQAIVIALKHSVLDGLQIRLTVGENGVLKAEFLAASEQVKNQLEARKQELTGIIRERGINLSEMSVRQGSDFEQNNQTDNNRFSEKNILPAESEKPVSDESDSELNNHISYRV